MVFEHFALVTPTIAYFKVRDVANEARIAYIDQTFVEWERYWAHVAAEGKHFCIIMNISELTRTHSTSREHMVKRLRTLNDAHPGTWIGTAIVATSMLTRGIATAYSWFASTFPGVSIKVFGNDDEATAWAHSLVKS